MTLYVAVSTAQNISNAIPLLCLMKAEDHLLLLESDTAVQNQWSRGLLKVLKKNGLRNIRTLKIREDGFIKSDVLLNYVQQLPDKPPVTLCLNGGKKSTAVTLAAALGRRVKQYVYLANRPVQMLISETDADPRPRKRELNHPLTIEDMLNIQDSVFYKGLKGETVYRRYPGFIPDKTDDSDDTLFFTDPDFVKSVYALYSGISAAWNEDTLSPVVNFDSAQTHRITKMIHRYMDKNWRHTPFKNLEFNRFDKTMSSMEKDALRKEYLTKYFYGLLKYLKETREDKIKGMDIDGVTAEKLSAAGLLNQTRDRRRISYSDLKMKFGPFFESMVWARLKRFLRNNPAYLDIMAEIRLNTGVAGRGTPELIAGEYDILIALNNGVMISLECKTFLFETKDVFARWARLTKRSGDHAGIWVTARLFTHESLYNAYMGMLYRNMKILNIPFVPYTMDRQPEKCPDTDSAEPLTVPGFEETLARLLDGYIPVKAPPPGYGL